MRHVMLSQSSFLAVVVARTLVGGVHSTTQTHIENVRTTAPVISGGCKTDVPQPNCGLQVWPMACSELLQAYEWNPKDAPTTSSDRKTCCSFSDTNDGQCLLTVAGAGHVCTRKELTSENYYSVLISDDSTSICPESDYEIPAPRKKTHAPHAAKSSPTPSPSPTVAPSLAALASQSLPSGDYMQMETSHSGACWATEPTAACGIYRWPTSCDDVLQAYEWSGSCCSFADTDDNGCTLTVDGPGSQCTWRADGSNYTIYMAETNENSCPSTDYTVDPSTQAGWSGPTPEPKIESRSCWTTEPNEECGTYSWDTPCSELVALYDWGGSCCSLSDTRDGCLLTVDGPGSECTWGTGGHDYTISIATSNQRSCPDSVYEISNVAPGTIKSATPKPMKSGECRTSSPDETCGIYTWSEPCSEVISRFEWSGTCCSFSTTNNGGCKLTVDGPGSVCTWKERNLESYYNVFIDQSNTNTCPESEFSCLRKQSPFITCVTDQFTHCISTCKNYPLLRQSFKACYKEDKTQALLCAAGAVSVCSELKGKAPKYLCAKIDAMFQSGALQIDQCLQLQAKCNDVLSESTCS